MKKREENEPDVGEGDGGISTRTSFEIESNFIVGDIEVIFWFEQESTNLGELLLDFRKLVILLMFLSCFDRLL